METKLSEGAPLGRILYVEDDEDSRTMLALMLKIAGYTVTTATSVAEALELHKLEHFNLYILDSRFADGSGIDLCRQLRALEPVAPIIFYSGLGYPSDIAAGLAAGAQGYLTKPMGIYTIVQTIAEVLTGAKPIQIEVQRVPAAIKDRHPQLALIENVN